MKAIHTGTYIPGIFLIRFASFVLLVLSIAQIFLGLKAYIFKTNIDIYFHFVGSFWAGFYSLLPAISGLISHDQTFVLVSFFSCILGFGILILGAVTDGTAFSNVSELMACSPALRNRANLSIVPQLYSVKSYKLAAMYCAYEFPNFDCSCTKDYISNFSGNVETIFISNPKCYSISGVRKVVDPTS